MLEHFRQFGDYMKCQSMYYYRVCQIKKAKKDDKILNHDKILNLQLRVKVCEPSGATDKQPA